MVRVALTFDAEHPDREPGLRAADTILDTLRYADIRATFFIQGRWAEAYPKIAMRIAREGHLIGSHSHAHAQMDLFHPEGFGADVRRAEDAIAAATDGVSPRPWFRFPWGTGRFDEKLVGRLRDLRYEAVGWNVVADDWDHSPEYVEAAVVDGVAAHPEGAVVLLHTWPAATATALPRIIERIHGDAIEFVTVETLSVP